MRLPRAVFFLSLTILWGCAEGTGLSESTFRVDTLENGVVSVVNDGTGAWDGSDSWTAVEDLRLGVVQGEGPTQFAVISGIAVDSVDRIFVAEAQAKEIRVFKRDGSVSHIIGQKGEGPGEFLVPYGLKLDNQG